MSAVEQLLSDAGERPDAAAMMRLQDATEALAQAGSQEAERLLGPGPFPFTQGWFQAALLDRLGRPREALAVLDILPEPDWGDPRALWLLTRARLTVQSGKKRPQAGEADGTVCPTDESTALGSPANCDFTASEGAVSDNAKILAHARDLLRYATRAAASYRLLRQIDIAWRQWVKRGGGEGLRPLRIAFAGTVTADFLFPALRAYLFADGFLPEIWNAPFGQYRQVILADDAALREFKPDLAIFATDWRSAAQGSSAATHVDELANLWSLCRERYGAAVIQWNYEVPVLDPMGRLGNLQPAARNHLLRAIDAELWEAERAGRGAFILDIDGIASEFGKAHWEDAAAWEISRQYPSAAATPLLARHSAALIRAIRGVSSKCLVLDLDNTLWGGVIGDDGLEGIQLGGTGSGAAYRLFQEYVRDLNRRGVLLAVCSKNDMDNALLPFQRHPEMVLKEADIAVFRANWEPKEVNLRAIAAAINIGTDSLVLADDNPAERARVRQMLPEVEVIELPAGPTGYRQAVQDSLRFEVTAITEEDLLRNFSIRANAQRDELAAAASTPEAYLQGLGMTVLVEPFTSLNLPRIVQLINKTNQFNLTGVRTNEAEVRDWMGCEGFYSQTIRLTDRFGEFGLTGILFGFVEDGTLKVRNWLMSCRILGRGIEECMLANAIRHSRAASVTSIEAEYLPTAKNGMVAGLYPRLGFEAVEKREGGAARYKLDLAGATAASAKAPAWLAIEGRADAL
jgi:FkbH-like protein